MTTPKRPSLAVIDKAIELIASEEYFYTCYALRKAQVDAECWPEDDMYVRQYRLHVSHGGWGSLPSWWNSMDRAKAERLAALKSFRRACVQAGKEL